MSKKVSFTKRSIDAIERKKDNNFLDVIALREQGKDIKNLEIVKNELNEFNLKDY